jgi:polyhydroxyalkanoate synthase
MNTPAPHRTSDLLVAASHHSIDAALKARMGRMTNGLSPASVASAFEDWMTHLAVSPGRQAELAEQALRTWLRWLLYIHRSSVGECGECVLPSPQDKRFSHQQWRNPPFNWLAQGFLLTQQWWTAAMTGVHGVSRHHEHVAEFLTRQYLDIWSPSNFPWTNPQVLQAALQSGGATLARGMANWWRDAMVLATNGSPPGTERFRPGETVAVTPGKVVLRNALIELIEYAPATRSVYPEPVLIVPSWIMKYYILDLSPRNSLVKYLVEQGHTVYMISWKNPGADDRDLRLNDYVEMGVLAALDAVERMRPRHRIHAMGYCLGGTLLAMAAAHAAKKSHSPLATVSLLAAQTDFEEPGELGLFIDESQIAFIEDVMSERGYLDGRQMAGAFAFINSKDLVWSKLVHEYLMGGQTPLTDLRAWNADATRMPQRMHSEYLRKLYLHNDLAEGRYQIDGQPIALKDIRLPLFAVSTERDHVSPWKSVYKIHLLTNAEVTYVLTTGGHNVGVVNPPAAAVPGKPIGYRYAVRPAGTTYLDPDSWYERASYRSGSWWPAWQAWLAAHSGEPIKPLPIGGRGQGRQPILGDAPGTYVREA